MKLERATGNRELDRYAVRVVDRALTVLEILRDAGDSLSLQEISKRLGIVKSSSFRLLCTLERRGYVQRADRDGRYQLGLRMMTFTGAPAGYQALVDIARPYMRQLLESFGETVNLGVLKDGEILYLEMLESSHSFKMTTRIGSHSPIHSSALGKAVAAYLPKNEVDAIIRARGLSHLTPHTITSPASWKRELARTRARYYAEDNGETEPEVSCIGAPIIGRGGTAIAAISISGPTSRLRASRPRAVIALVRACKAISRIVERNESTTSQKGQ